MFFQQRLPMLIYYCAELQYVVMQLHLPLHHIIKRSSPLFFSSILHYKDPNTNLFF